MLEQQSNFLNPLEHVSEEPANKKQVINEKMIPQEITLRRSARQKRPAILNDYVVYLLEHECDLSVDMDLVSFKQSMECNNSKK